MSRAVVVAVLAVETLRLQLINVWLKICFLVENVGGVGALTLISIIVPALPL